MQTRIRLLLGLGLHSLPRPICLKTGSLRYLFYFSQQSRIYGYQHLRSNKWLAVEMVCLFVSVVDWTITISIGCTEVIYFTCFVEKSYILKIDKETLFIIADINRQH